KQAGILLIGSLTSSVYFHSVLKPFSPYRFNGRFLLEALTVSMGCIIGRIDMLARDFLENLNK
ncbi:hypothetical protein, partial [Enterovibrio calviensis]|uniref:hypothetical protein n=1 Tax=Enterovibrio calviensis TaxID=91359 RepID=UPI003736DA29